MTFFNYFYVEIWVEFLISYTVKTNCYNDTKSETNAKNDSKDNPEDDSITKSNCIGDNTLFLFSFDFILANSSRNHKHQEQNSSNFHFAWRNFSVFRSCWLFLIEFQVMAIFNAFWFDGKIVCMQFYLAEKLLQFRIPRFFLEANF